MTEMDANSLSLEPTLPYHHLSLRLQFLNDPCSSQSRKFRLKQNLPGGFYWNVWSKMRLLEQKPNGEFSLTKDLVAKIPAYAILSHTWGDDDQEVSFRDIAKGSGKSKAGYRKIRFCGEQAARDGLRYFWVDTCCIDKSNNAELSEALNSMYRWYRDAVKCYAYLADVSINDYNPTRQPSQIGEEAFRTSRWFTRGWTLQELIAPPSVEFFSFEGNLLGDKRSLEQQIHDITGVALSALQGKPPTEFSVTERFSWAVKRETQREEDKAYSLLGIFGIYMPLIYGEGSDNALRRLRDEVDKSAKFLKPSFEVKPQFTVPFVRDLEFIGREDIIQEITNRFEKQRRIALSGIGGIGKSQIAIEYCYIWNDRHPQCHVFWVHVSTLESFEQAYRNIAKTMSIPGSEDPQSNTLVLVRDWLSNPENGSWLLVLDNADDQGLFFEMDSPSKEVRGPRIGSFLPRNPNGSIIITTRDIRIGQRLTDRGEVIMITPLTLQDAEQLLCSRILRWDNANTEDIQDLVKVLGLIPLAITQAAAFIQENGMGVKLYIEELKGSDSDLQDYLEEDLPDPRRYPDSENSVIRTWKLSFDQIAKQRPRAAELLSLMVQLDRQAIPKGLLKQEGERSIEFNKAVGTLQAYSLIKTERGGSNFEVHRLIQISTQRWLRLQNREAEWQEKALRLMVERFPDGEYGTWQECEDLLLHAKSVIKCAYISKEALLQQAQLLENLATYELNQGKFEPAYLYFKISLRIRESNLSEKHPSTLATMNNLGFVLNSQGKYTEAETLYHQTIDFMEEVLGKNHPSTLTTIDNLAQVLASQGKYTEAETLYCQTLDLKEEVLGKKHPSTHTTMNNLAQVLNSQGKYAEAEAIYRQTLDLDEEVLGKKHPSTLATMNNLAQVLASQGKYTEAETIYRQTLDLKEEILGKKHPSTHTTMNNLARVLDSQGKYTEAETLYHQTLDLKEEVLGKKHPSTLTTMNNLAQVLASQGKYTEAETLYRQTLELREEILGKKHPSTLTTVDNLAQVLTSQDKYTEAETIYRQTLDLKEEVLGKKHPSTLTTMNNIAQVLASQGKYTEAETIYRQTIDFMEEVLGKKHPSALITMNNLARVLASQGKYTEAEPMNRQALELMEEVLGKEHPSTLVSIEDLAHLLQDRNKYTEASILYQQACDGYESKLGTEHPRTIACRSHHLRLLDKMKKENLG